VAASGGIAIDQYRNNAATTQAGDQIAALLAEPDARTVHALVVLHDLKDLPSDQTYQLWLIDSSKTAHSIGLAAGQESRDQIKLIASGVTGKVAFGLTVEPAGGPRSRPCPPRRSSRWPERPGQAHRQKADAGRAYRINARFSTAIGAAEYCGISVIAPDAVCLTPGAS
jgi:hypothetical protein